MDRQAQIDFILDHYENPRHYGPLPGATVVRRGGNPGCGDVVTFYLQLDPDEHITDISFEGEGCTISQAASSMVTELFAGKMLEDVERTSTDVILGLIGPEIAGVRLRCAMLGLDTVKRAARAARRDSRDSDNV
jgi:nitrogen fixation protein NifU and related proteins